MATFAERLKELRGECNLTQDSLGKIAGVSRYAIYTYEKGKVFPTVEGLTALADYFGVTTDYLLGRSDSKQ